MIDAILGGDAAAIIATLLVCAGLGGIAWAAARDAAQDRRYPTWLPVERDEPTREPWRPRVDALRAATAYGPSEPGEVAALDVIDVIAADAD